MSARVCDKAFPNDPMTFERIHVRPVCSAYSVLVPIRRKQKGADAGPAVTIRNGPSGGFASNGHEVIRDAGYGG